MPEPNVQTVAALLSCSYDPPRNYVNENPFQPNNNNKNNKDKKKIPFPVNQSSPTLEIFSTLINLHFILLYLYVVCLTNVEYSFFFLLIGILFGLLWCLISFSFCMKSVESNCPNVCNIHIICQCGVTVVVYVNFHHWFAIDLLVLIKMFKLFHLFKACILGSSIWRFFFFPGKNVSHWIFYFFKKKT